MKTTIPYKEVTIRPYEKPWYDSEICNCLENVIVKGKKAINSLNQSDWLNYKIIRNKVNTLKKYAKESFYNNLEISLLDSFTNSRKDYCKIIRHFFLKMKIHFPQYPL